MGKKDTIPAQARQYQKVISGGPPATKDLCLELINEEPFMIQIEEKPYSVVMRTPGNEVSHAAGFCLGEGMIDSFDDIKTIGYDLNLDPNVVNVWLTSERKEKVKSLLQRKIFVSQTSCGICGKEMVRDLFQSVIPTTDDFSFSINRAFDCINKLSENQKYYQTTRGSHAAILFDAELNTVAFSEDVGRHNALDKTIGRALMNKELQQAKILVLSSRISYELVQKAARADIPIMISNSRPTALAVEMGSKMNMTLAFPASESRLTVVCGYQRIHSE